MCLFSASIMALEAALPLGQRRAQRRALTKWDDRPKTEVTHARGRFSFWKMLTCSSVSCEAAPGSWFIEELSGKLSGKSAGQEGRG